jgi:hypothetical protein
MRRVRWPISADGSRSSTHDRKGDMNYTALIKDSFRIAWNNRFLWLFGFFAGGGGSASLPNSGSQDSARAVSALRSLAESVLSNPGLMIGLALAGAALLLVFVVLHFLSYGGLVRTAADMEEGKRPSFDDALGHGYRYFWKMVGMQVLFFLSLVAFIAVVAGPPIVMLAGNGALKAAAVAWLVALLLPALAALLLMMVVMILATRIAIIDDAPVGDAVARAAGLVRRRFSDCASLFGVGVAVAIAFSFLLIAAVVLLAVPFVVAGMVNPWLGLIPGLAIGLPLLVIVQCVYGVYSSAYWTVGYMRLFPKPAGPAASTAGQVRPADPTTATGAA